MITLALDLSMKCTGWAVGSNGSLKEFGMLEGTDKGSEGHRFVFMDRRITSLLQEQSPDEVIFAEFHNTPTALSGHASLGLRAILLRRCEVLKLKVRPVSEISARSKLGVNLSPKLEPSEQADLQRRTARWLRLGKKTKKPKGKRDMKARVDVALRKLELKIENDDARDAVALLLGDKRG